MWDRGIFCSSGILPFVSYFDRASHGITYPCMINSVLFPTHKLMACLDLSNPLFSLLHPLLLRPVYFSFRPLDVGSRTGISFRGHNSARSIQRQRRLWGCELQTGFSRTDLKGTIDEEIE